MAALRDSSELSKWATTRVARTSRARIWRIKYRGIFRSTLLYKTSLARRVERSEIFKKTAPTRIEYFSKAQLQNLRVGLRFFFSLTARAPEKCNFKVMEGGGVGVKRPVERTLQTSPVETDRLMTTETKVVRMERRSRSEAKGSGAEERDRG